MNFRLGSKIILPLQPSPTFGLLLSKSLESLEMKTRLFFFSPAQISCFQNNSKWNFKPFVSFSLVPLLSLEWKKMSNLIFRFLGDEEEEAAMMKTQFLADFRDLDSWTVFKRRNLFKSELSSYRSANLAAEQWKEVIRKNWNRKEWF